MTLRHDGVKVTYLDNHFQILRKDIPRLSKYIISLPGRLVGLLLHSFHLLNLLFAPVIRSCGIMLLLIDVMLLLSDNC